MAEREPIGVIGTGYVGLVTAVGFAELGSDVWCIDIDEAKIDGLKRGVVPIWEPGLEELLAKHKDRMHFSTTLADALEHARLLFVAVGTPPLYSGDADLSAVHAVVDSMPPSDHHALVMKSTVPVGTGRNIRRIFEEQGKSGFRYVSCPEFLKEGSAIDDFLRPDRVVIGDEGDWAGDAVEELYAPLRAPIVRTDIPSAEMVKLAANAFLATKISFINEIANVCEVTGADVTEVARGIGLDDRIGPKFLQAGIGFGGSCLAGDETVLARRAGRTSITRLDDLYARFEADEELEVMAWRPGMPTPEFLPVLGVSRRPADEVVEVRTKMGRRVVCTPDHPFVVSCGGWGGDEEIKLARDLDERDWLPLAIGPGETPTEQDEVKLHALAALELAGLTASDVIVRPAARHLAGVFAEQASVLDHPRGAAARSADIRRSGALRYDEAALLEIPLEGATVATAKNGIPLVVDGNEAFWRIVGLYIAEGHCAVDGARHRLQWSFHPSREEHLVEEVAGFWRARGVRADVRRTPTTASVVVSSRLLATWWTQHLGLGRNAYGQRLPDYVWDLSENCQRALLSGLWEGDGSWSLVSGGPSVILEFGTVSRELADGVLRLLAQLGTVAGQRIGRTAKSTKDTHWLRVAGAEQIERALFLVPHRDRPGVLASIARQSKRIAPTGYRKRGNAAWVRVCGAEPRPYAGDVYSLEVGGAHTFVTTGGVVAKNCFPKDVSALKQLAGNSGYHFQLLASVLEVNDLQKRKVIQKLQKHLGSLVGKRIALLGLAFKPNTDDMREASSLVLSARLQSDGAIVRAFDPVAEDEARKLIHGVEFASDPLDCVRGADAVVLVTEWQQFRDLDWREVAGAMAGRLIVDGRNALDPDAIRAAGLDYEGIGRQSRVSLPV
ncbi:MAG: nucleotide sugar dehydrogenase [Actinobacteria bacterium]|nr:MAG: nucleotide sugar dehydrogenase [Actinomycetota bacterium]